MKYPTMRFVFDRKKVATKTHKGLVQIEVLSEGKRKWEFVSSHTARRSFATNLYLRGADLYSISQMMGHASVEMTQNYLCCGLREQSAQVMEYFK
jgi:site-specific recombinase XerD